MLRIGLLLAMVLAVPVADAAEISVSQWGNSFSGLPYVVALERGMFQQAGIDVTGVIGANGGGGTAVRNVLASELPYGDVAASAAIAAQREGLDVVIVNSSARSLVQGLVVVLPNSPVKSLADLVGKKITVTTPRSVSEMTLLMALAKDGLDKAKFTRVSAGGYGQGLIMLDHGSVDAASLIEPMYDMRANDYRIVMNAAVELPPVIDHVCITTRAFAKAHPAEVRALVAGHRAAVRAIYADPASAEAAAAKSFKLTPEVAHLTMTHMMAAHMWTEGEFPQAELNSLADAMRMTGELSGDVEWSGLIDASFLPDDLKVPSPGKHP